ncbi:MAG: hypothetical protein JW807_00880 [Spirochaetes bacterium]|nr:hypothetical protein [Spirochaetota bacterium]
MARADKEHLEKIVGDLDSVQAARLDLILETARGQVVRDGISESHNSFADLQCFFAAYILEKSGVLHSLVSRSVGDVSVTFGQGAQVSSWLDLYRMMKSNIIGLPGRIA